MEMSLEGYIVGKVENPFLWQEGDHLGEIIFVGTKEGKFGKYVAVEWFSDKEKTNLLEAFDLWSSDEKIKAWHKSEWHKLLQSVGLKEGEPYSESKVFGKKCHLTVKTYKNKNTGSEKSVVSKRVPFVNESTPEITIVNPEQSIGDGLNDEIPF